MHNPPAPATDIAPQAVAVLRLAQGGTVLAANPVAQALLSGLGQANPIGLPLSKALPWAEAAAIAALLDMARAGQACSLHLAGDGPKHSPIRLEATLLPLGDGSGETICSLREIAPPALGQTAQDLLRGQALTVLDTISEGVQALARDGKLLYQNAAAARMFEIGLDKLGVMQVHDVLHHSHPDGTPYAQEDCPIHQTVRDGKPRHIVDEVFFRASGSAFPVEYSVLPVPDTRLTAGQAPDQVSHLGAILSFRDVTDRKLGEALRQLEIDHLDAAGHEVTNGAGLQMVAETIDRMLPAFRSAIMVVGADGKLHGSAAPHLPPAYMAALDGLPIAEAAGACGTAAFRKKPVFVTDTQSDPLWHDLRDLAQQHHLGACWATPVIGLHGDVLAVVSLYSDRPRQPTVQDSAIMSRIGTFLQNLIERSQQRRALRESDARYEDIFHLAPVSIWEYDIKDELALVRRLQAQGVSDLAAYLDAHPEVLTEAFGYHRVKQVNAHALALYGAKSLEELSDGFHAAANTAEFRAVYRDYLVALAAGKPRFVASGTAYRLDGSAFQCLTEMSLPQGNSTRVLMAELDVTEQETIGRRFHSIIQTTANAVFDHDLRDDTFWWSEGLMTSFGHDPAALAGSTDQWAALVHPDDLPKVQEILAQARKTPDMIVRTSYRFRRGDGSYAHIEERARVLTDAAGRPQRMIGTLVDVTDRAMAEQRFRIVAENTSDVVFESDRSEDRLWWSEGFRTTFGHDPETAAHNVAAFMELIHPDDLDRLIALNAAWERAPASRFRAEYRLRRADGRYANVEVRSRRVFDSSEGPARVVGALIDITERKAIEERLHLAVKVTSDVIWDMDLVANSIWWSDGLCDKLGIAEAALSSDPQVWRNIIHPDDRDRVTKDFAATVAGSTDLWADEYRLLHADGHFVTVRDTARILRDSAGVAYRAVGAIVDLTQTRQLEAQLARAQRLETVGQLTGGIAHDFNNLLAIVMGSADLLLDRVPPEGESTEMVQMILAAAERGAALTDRLLSFARQRSLSPQVVAPAAVIEALVPMLKRTLGPGIEVQLSLQAPPMATLDVAQLENALINLCVNARDAMPDGGTLRIGATGVTLAEAEAQRIPDLAAGSYVLVTVEDSGTGMSEATLSHIFEPFFSTKDVGKGTGLGLPMIHGFVRQSGGGIHIDSQLGHGTTVRLYFPATQDITATALSPRKLQDATPRHGHILLVDDDELVRVQTRHSLISLNCQVTEAASAHEAIKLLQDGLQVDLILSDIMMPGGMDGRQFAAQLKVSHPDLPVLLTTGYSKGLSDAPSTPPILFKPYHLEDLRRHLAALLPA